MNQRKSFDNFLKLSAITEWALFTFAHQIFWAPLNSALIYENWARSALTHTLFATYTLLTSGYSFQVIDILSYFA